MQGLDPSFLKKMTGLEYEVLPSPQAPPSLFVVRQLERTSPQFARSLRLFYILDGAIYLAPSLHSVLSKRLSKVAFHAQSALSVLQETVAFDAVKGYEWKDGAKERGDFLEDEEEQTCSGKETEVEEDEHEKDSDGIGNGAGMKKS